MSTAKPDAENSVAVWPHLLFIELIATLIITAGLWVFSLLVDAPLEEIANPNMTPLVAKAPWYFVGLQELLVYFDPWIAGVMLPTVIIIGLVAIPYIDCNRARVGHFSFRGRRAAVSIFVFGLALWFGLIFIGTFCRGPNWAWYWPWESWDVLKHPAQQPTGLPQVAGLALIFGYVAVGFWFAKKLWPDLPARWGRLRATAAMGLLLLMLAVPIKILLHLVFNLGYVLDTPWFRL